MSGTGREGENKEAALISSHVPTDLYEEILYRLPSNDLQNFKHVCKDWRRLISSKEFIHKHLQRSKADCNHPKLVLSRNYSMVVLDCANNTSKKISFDHYRRVYVLGCCDGLVLYYNSWGSKMAALNPNTGESVVRTLHPSIQEDIEYRSKLIFSWFGHHPSTGEYVLVLANSLRRDHSKTITISKVYSLSLAHNNITPVLLSSSTSELDTYFDDNYYENKIATLLHGRLHYPVNFLGSKTVLLVYDFETSKIMRMSHSSPVESRILIYGVVDGCLCALAEDDIVWMMKEYGVKESWTKYAKIEGYEDSDILLPLTFCPNGDLIITDKEYLSKLSRYNFKEREISILNVAYENCIIDEGIACIDSLVSPTSVFREDR